MTADPTREGVAAIKRRPRRTLDREKTEMQATGGFMARGLTLSEILEVVNDLGIDVNEVAVADTAVWVLP